MAATGARVRKPVGSAAWIATEKENFQQLVNQEMEEVEYPVRHEMDWLNEHMAEIFSNNQFNFTEAFKTPGKMRGKTPRTARKRDPNEARVPLSEIFSASHKKFESKIAASPAVQRSPAKSAATTTAIPTPTKAKNATEPSSQPHYPDLTQNLNSFPQYNTDSGYHGMPEGDADEADDDDMVLTQVQPDSQPSTQPFNEDPFTAGDPEPPSSVDRRTTSASFHSAQEEVRQRGETMEPMQVDTTPKQAVEVHPPPPHTSLKKTMKQSGPKHKEEPEGAAPEPQGDQHLSEEAVPSPVKPSIPQASEPNRGKNEETDEMALDNIDDIGSPSDGSTPERPPIRKSSLTFASLPAREPLTKKSLGGTRISRTSHVDLAKINNNTGMSGYLGRQTGGHRATQVAFDESAAQADKMDVDENKEQPEEPDASKLHNKSSTQRLHEKISMLGKLQPSRPTKSIPSVSGLSSQVAYPELPTAKSDAKRDSLSRKSRETPGPEPSKSAENDDWIKPLDSPYRVNTFKSQADKEKRAGSETHNDREISLNRDQKIDREGSVRPSSRHALETLRGKSSTPISSPYRPGHYKTQSVPNIDPYASTTPVGSPRHHDAPLSASKSRLQSIVKSAKGLFSNSGDTSAAARFEASSPDEPRLRHMNTDVSSLKESKKAAPPQPESPVRQEGRRTRSSTEKEEKRKQREREERQREEEEEAERIRQQEKERAISQEKSSKEYEDRGDQIRPSSPQKVPPQKYSKEPERTIEAPSRTRAQSVSQQQSLKQNDRRPLKPAREALQKPKPQPQPVSIRVGSALSRQIPLASSAVSSVTETSATAPTPASATKQPSIKKKASNTSLHTSASNSSFKSSVSSQSQKKAQLASERKREQEEREARRKEEQKRELERKRAADEARRQEARSRAETDRWTRPTPEDPKKAAQMQAIEKRRLENARRLERQGSQQPVDVGSLPQEKPSQSTRELPRPASRIGSVQPFGRSINPPQPNPAKPPKRGAEEEANRRPATAKPGTMQPSGETKRRRTEDGQNPVTRPTMAPPIRQSNIRKESNIIRKEPTKHSMYGLPQSSAHQTGSSIFKAAQPQRPGHPMDMSKYASGKIPFAEPANANPQATSHKTPGASSSQKAPKPSPNYPNGENINLPEIATDSEDEDSDAEMLPVPKWAQPKELETLLRQQEGMEVDSIFGPIAPFSLEETFKSDKKIKKFRERTSSANWSGPDGLTQDEIRRDLAERQRLRLNGGWTFGN
ncbi:hypothetical protein HFD88_001054 [Aspergillus terreus]|nr:hypothetical protein HFD88_001054 [Aspergillus terreus]